MRTELKGGNLVFLSIVHQYEYGSEGGNPRGHSRVVQIIHVWYKTHYPFQGEHPQKSTPTVDNTGLPGIFIVDITSSERPRTEVSGSQLLHSTLPGYVLLKGPQVRSGESLCYSLAILLQTDDKLVQLESVRVRQVPPKRYERCSRGAPGIRRSCWSASTW